MVNRSPKMFLFENSSLRSESPDTQELLAADHYQADNLNETEENSFDDWQDNLPSCIYSSTKNDRRSFHAFHVNFWHDLITALYGAKMQGLLTHPMQLWSRDGTDDYIESMELMGRTFFLQDILNTRISWNVYADDMIVLFSLAPRLCDKTTKKTEINKFINQVSNLSESLIKTFRLDEISPNKFVRINHNDDIMAVDGALIQTIHNLRRVKTDLSAIHSKVKQDRIPMKIDMALSKSLTLHLKVSFSLTSQPSLPNPAETYFDLPVKINILSHYLGFMDTIEVEEIILPEDPSVTSDIKEMIIDEIQEQVNAWKLEQAIPDLIRDLTLKLRKPLVVYYKRDHQMQKYLERFYI